MKSKTMKLFFFIESTYSTVINQSVSQSVSQSINQSINTSVVFNLFKKTKKTTAKKRTLTSSPSSYFILKTKLSTTVTTYNVGNDKHDTCAEQRW